MARKKNRQSQTTRRGSGPSAPALSTPAIPADPTQNSVIDAWIGAGNPLAPMNQGTAGRQLDFPTNQNLFGNRERDIGVRSHRQLRALAENCDILATVIDNRLSELRSLKWRIRPRDEKAAIGAKPDPRIEQLTKLLRRPSFGMTWDEWIYAIGYDHLVLDAAAIEPRKTLMGDLQWLDYVDAASIKLVIDDEGRTPQPPLCAYQQWFRGQPWNSLAASDLIYIKGNPRTNKLYGYSKVEMVANTVDIAMRRTTMQKQFFTEGNVPEAIATVPPEWGPEQIAKYQAYWDFLMEGDTAARRHMHFVPGGTQVSMIRPNDEKNVFDEWLTRIICKVFNVSPADFVSNMNRATGQASEESAQATGLAPLQLFVENFINERVIFEIFGWDDLCFDWEEDEVQDPLKQAQVNQIYFSGGILTVDEVRARIGLPPMTPQQKEDTAPPPPAAMFPNGQDENGAPLPPPKAEDDASVDELGKSLQFILAKAKKKVSLL